MQIGEVRMLSDRFVDNRDRVVELLLSPIERAEIELRRDSVRGGVTRGDEFLLRAGEILVEEQLCVARLIPQVTD
jgi:hypothetical protein